MGPSLTFALLLGCGVPVPPTADAGADAELPLGAALLLYGDGWGDTPIAEWRWSVIRAPSGSAVGLSPPDEADTSVTPDKPGYYTFGLSVSDAWGTPSPVDAVNVLVLGEDSRPVAELEGIESGDPPALYLDGRGSYDPEGEPLDYRWTVLVAPAGSLAGVAPASLTGTAVLQPDLPGIYAVGLTVSDGLSTSGQASITWQLDEGG